MATRENCWGVNFRSAKKFGFWFPRYSQVTLIDQIIGVSTKRSEGIQSGPLLFLLDHGKLKHDASGHWLISMTVAAASYLAAAMKSGGSAICPLE
jgi:hypothetical protein